MAIRWKYNVTIAVSVTLLTVSVGLLAVSDGFAVLCKAVYTLYVLWRDKTILQNIEISVDMLHRVWYCGVTTTNGGHTNDNHQQPTIH